MDTAFSKQLILVVDDDATVRILVRDTLEQAGFTVEEAQDGLAGIHAFQRCEPNLVLLDVLMPNMDGFDACAALRRLDGGKYVPILMMTGLHDSDSINRAYEIGATDFITKPLSWPVLAYRVRYLLRATQAFLDLAQIQTRLANAQRIAQLGHWEWRVGTDQIQCSDEIYRIVGRSREVSPVVPNALLEIVHPDDRAEAQGALRTIHRQHSLSIELRVVQANGTLRIVHLQAETTFDRSGKLNFVQGTLQDITERKRVQEQIHHLSLHDSLTGLANRQLFNEQLTHAIALAQRSGRGLAMLSLNLDRFHRINDTLGRAVGDLVLKEVAARLIASLRQIDYITRNDHQTVDHHIARHGGDEFTVLLVNLNLAHDVTKVARRILDALSRPFAVENNEIVVSASIGVALYPLDGNDADSLFKSADAAMYYAKEQGKNNCQFYNRKMNTSALEKLTMENDLRKALESDNFILYYQPKVDYTTGAIVGAEALIRLCHPHLGMILPADFIPLAEETGLIIPIGEWVLRSACLQMRKWHDAGYTWMQVAVNMSSLNFKHEGFENMVQRVLAESRLPPHCIEFEMTESLLLHDAEAMIDMLKRLKATGLKLSIDDFGTGYSSLSYLKQFPLDVLKIDRSFVNDITVNMNDANIASAIIAVARSLKLAVIAEGVETEAQASLLSKQGCRYMQGYLFGHPLSDLEFTALLSMRANADNTRNITDPRVPFIS